MKRIGILICAILCANVAYGETIRYWVDGSLHNVSSCDSGQDVVLPTAPTPPTGYIFAGWRVDTYDFSTLQTASDGDASYGRGRNLSDGTSVCYTGATVATCDSVHVDLKQHDWKTVFSWGTVYGKAICSVTNGTYPVAGTPDETTANGKYCWCKATGYKSASADNNGYDPVSSIPWVFNYDRTSASECSQKCAKHCASHLSGDASMRQAVFGI